MSSSRKSRRASSHSAHVQRTSRQTIEGLKQEQVQAYIRQGPLPDPLEFEGYERILPGSAERIMKAFDEERAHRMKMDESSHLLAHKSSRRRFSATMTVIWFLIVFALLLIGTAFYLIVQGEYAYGVGLLGGTAVLAVLARVYEAYSGKSSE